MKRTIFTILIIMLSVSTVYAKETSLTVYNNDLAIVKIADEMRFEKGFQIISFTDVSERIDPTSVLFSAEEKNVNIIEQNFRYDLVNSQKVLERYIDKAITIWVKEGELIEGILQSVKGDVVIKGKDGGIKIVKIGAIERFEFPELPEGLITRPTLFWKLFSEKGLKTNTEVSYMTGGFDWHAEYTAVVSDDEREMEISSWISVNNNSGATFEDATLKLVAGEVHRIRPGIPIRREIAAKATLMQEEARVGFEERELFEYHLYELQGRTTVNNAEIKQIALFPVTTTKVRKLLIYDSWKNAIRVSANIEFTNSEKDGMGMPLPAGKVRVYKHDTDGAIEFVGEDALYHTPKNEKVRLMLGTSFDIVAERKVVDTRRISQTIREDTIEIALRNRKEESVSVMAVEHLMGDWEIIRKSDDFVKKDAYTAEFTVEIPADSEKTITYTVRYR